jgi:hypothetical protein
MVGFDATVAIHPSRVAVIRAAYTPSPERVSWAQRLLAAVAVDLVPCPRCEILEQVARKQVRGPGRDVRRTRFAKTTLREE